MNHNKINESGYNEAPKFGPSDNNPSMYMFDKKYDLKGEEFIKPISSTYSIKNKIMNQIDIDYLNLVRDILENGNPKNDRTKTGTISVFGRTIRHSMKDGFPLLTTKKMAWKTMVTELLWFLRGDTNIKYLVDNGCHIWDGYAYKNYLKYTVTGVNAGLDILKGYLDNCLVEFEGYYEHFTNPSFQYGYRPLTKEEFINKIKTDDGFAKKWGDLGPIYGAQWRGRLKGYGFNEITGHPLGYSIEPKLDQIANVIHLLKTDPDSRRMIVNAWNVGELDQMVLPPCHYGFQVYTRELSFNARYRIGKYQPYSIERKVEYESGLDYITEDQFENFHNEEMDKLNIPTRAISLRWDQRSVDVGLGLPFNIASYALLLEIIAKYVNMVPEELIGDLGDCHIYNNHIDGLKEQLDRIPYELPKLDIHPGILGYDLDKLDKDMFTIENYQSHPSIKLTLSN